MPRNWFDEIAPPTLSERLWSIVFALIALAIAFTVIFDVVIKTWPVLLGLAMAISLVFWAISRRRWY